MGWYAHPIFKNGDYPPVTKDYVAKKDAEAGLLPIKYNLNVSKVKNKRYK